MMQLFLKMTNISMRYYIADSRAVGTDRVT